MKEIYGDRQVVLVRELTKLYEEYQRGTISQLLGHIEKVPLKGECLIIVDGKRDTERVKDSSQQDPLVLVKEYIANGDKTNQAIKKVAKELNLNRQELYASSMIYK